MAQAVSGQLLCAEICVPFEEVPSRKCGGQNVELWLVFSSERRMYPVSIIPHTFCIIFI
jgi:hypothetical protein